jgi:hypothetical protein
MNVMYESLRPTTTLKDAANNTSAPPHDLGDGPAHASGRSQRPDTQPSSHRESSTRPSRSGSNHPAVGRSNRHQCRGKGSNVGQAVVFLCWRNLHGLGQD